MNIQGVTWYEARNRCIINRTHCDDGVISASAFVHDLPHI